MAVLSGVRMIGSSASVRDCVRMASEQIQAKRSGAGASLVAGFSIVEARLYVFDLYLYVLSTCTWVCGFSGELGRGGMRFQRGNRVR